MTIMFTLFDTAIGRCAIAWGPRGIIGVQLPEADETMTHARVLQRFLGARETLPPPYVARARNALSRLLRGEASDLAAIPLDMESSPPFHRRVFEAARAILYGATATYGELAKLAGAPGAARAVGQALARNPFPIIVPCHRVLAAGGKTGGFSASGGVCLKLRLLAIEGWETQEKGGLGKRLLGRSGAPCVATQSRRTG
jgi:methylated-DNA-[protein]-cysteine S-methyltransferase